MTFPCSFLAEALTTLTSLGSQQGMSSGGRTKAGGAEEATGPRKAGHEGLELEYRKAGEAIMQYDLMTKAYQVCADDGGKGARARGGQMRREERRGACEGRRMRTG